MTTATVQSGRLYRQIAEQIASDIANEVYLPGQRLPSERDLAEQLGVSRPIIREAMIALEIAGLVEVRKGSGVFVRQQEGSDLAEAGGEPGPFELLEARAALEGEVAAIAAGNVTERDVQDLQRHLERIEATDPASEEHDEADRAFHHNIAAISNNQLLISFVDTLWSQRHRPMWQRLQSMAPEGQVSAAVTSDHRRILQAIRARDPERARAAMRAHLERVREQLIRLTDTDADSDSGL